MAELCSVRFLCLLRITFRDIQSLCAFVRFWKWKIPTFDSFHSLILGFFADRLDSIETVLQENNVFIVLLVFWFVAVVTSIYYCFRCFKPHMELNYDKNVFFFKDAVDKFGDVKEYSKELMKVCATEKQIVQKLSEQIHAESVIIDRKFYNVKRASQFFIISFLVLILALLYGVYLTLY